LSSRELCIYLDGVLAGELRQSSSGDLRFTYDESYQQRDSATPLSLSMPLTAREHRKRVTLPFFQGLLPDSEQALRAIGRRFGVSERNPFALLEHVGADVAGALQILPPGAASTDALHDGAEPPALTDNEVEILLDHAVSEYDDGTPFDSASGHFSIAGAQPKIALHRRQDGRWAVADGPHPTTHIIKPVAGGLRRIDVVEWMTMTAATQLGLTVAGAELEHIGKWPVFITPRFDREFTDDRWRRLHQEDLCQALAVPPSKKYQRRDGGPGTAAIGDLLRSLPFDTDRRAAGEAFYRALIFNTVAACTDAHAKNYSVLLDGMHVRLAPLYDLASYAGYWNRQSGIEVAMSIGGEYRLSHMSTGKLVGEARRFGLASDAAEAIVESTRHGMVEAFEAARAAIGRLDSDGEAAADDLIRGVRELPLTPRADGGI
jgi:serine/threonine-protein kinase HipA